MPIYFALTVWIGWLAGNFTHARIIDQLPSENETTVYRVGIDLPGDVQTFCKESGQGARN